MNNVRIVQFWKNWGLIPRLMLAVGIAIIAAGGVQTVHVLPHELMFVLPLTTQVALAPVPQA